MSAKPSIHGFSHLSPITRANGSKTYMISFEVLGAHDADAFFSERFATYTCPDLEKRTHDKLWLDPGGMVCIADENKVSFEVETPIGLIDCRSFWDKLGGVIDCIDHGREITVCGQKFWMFSQMQSLCYIPVEAVQPLRDKLLDLTFSEEGNEATLRHKNIRRGMAEEGRLAVKDSEGNWVTGPGTGQNIK